jgi:hypothetical protein
MKGILIAFAALTVTTGAGLSSYQRPMTRFMDS